MSRVLIVDPLRPPAFWNWQEVIRLFGYKAWQPGLGLLTVAACLDHSRHEINFVDENIRPVTRDEWEAADVVLTGGMLPQQIRMLELIDEAHRYGKRIVVGGADPSAQSAIYSGADGIVCGDAEAFAGGILRHNGIIQAGQCDIHDSPVPCYHLIRPKDYLAIPVQWSRGCPHGCEYCYCRIKDGDHLRGKYVQQILDELNEIYELGHRGWVDVVDDCLDAFPGRLEDVLYSVHAWCQARNFPFRFSAQTSIKLGERPALMKLMYKCGFKAAFVGIETPAKEPLAAAGKRVNTTGNLDERILAMQRHGLAVSSGFMLGLDGEPDDTGDQIIETAQRLGIPVAMISLTAVLPGTALAERLQEEGRLYDTNMRKVGRHERYMLKAIKIGGSVPDQTSTGGLLFDTERDRRNVLIEHARCWNVLYKPEQYCQRIYTAMQELHLKPVHKFPILDQLRMDIGVLKLWWALRKEKGLRSPMRQLIFRALRYGQPGAEYAITQLAAYLRFRVVRDQMRDMLAKRLERETEAGLLR